MTASNIQTTNGNVSASATISTAAKGIAHADFGFTAAQLLTAERAFITSTKAAARYRWDGNAPTAELGHLLPQDASPPLEVLGNHNINNLQFILDNAAAIDAIVFITLEW